jgi:hypothetical protein
MSKVHLPRPSEPTLDGRGSPGRSAWLVPNRLQNTPALGHRPRCGALKYELFPRNLGPSQLPSFDRATLSANVPSAHRTALPPSQITGHPICPRASAIYGELDRVL